MPLAAALCLLQTGKLDLRERWVYVATNLLVNQNVDELETLFARAVQARYNGVMLADSKFGRLPDMDDRYFRNCERVRWAAKQAGLKIIPAVFPVGYSESVLSRDPNLAEGMPVRDALFVVQGGQARLEPDPPVALGRPSWKDKTVSDGFVVTDPQGQNARIVYKVKVRPFRQYHVSARVKTENFRGEPKIAALARGRSLNYADLHVRATQDWTTHHAVFNSLDADEVNLYLGCWDGKTGTLQWADPKIEETGRMNRIRRDGAPLVVKREDVTLVEGKDFERVVDPKMGHVPYAGSYDVWHEPPTIRTNLPDGTRLRVSYYHVVTIIWGQVMICPSEPKTLDVLRDHAKRVHAIWGAPAYFMSHDEIRVLNWCEACQRRRLDAGAMIADNARACTKILKELDPKIEIYVWSDMFDPHHNAHENYYLVNGNLAGAWEGLDKNVGIAAWFYTQRDISMKWFADRGHPILIAGYYDAPLSHTRDWLESAKKVTGSVVGYMYTTWKHKYEDLEAVGKLLQEYSK